MPRPAQGNVLSFRHKFGIDPRFKAAAVWIPLHDGRDLMDRSRITVLAMTRSHSDRGPQWHHVSTDFSNGLSVASTAATYESLLFVFGSVAPPTTSSRIICGNSTHGVGGDGAGSQRLRASDTTRLTLARTPQAYEALYSSHLSAAYVLATRDEWLVNTGSFGSNRPSSVAMLDCIGHSLTMLIRWDDFQPPMAMVQELLNDPSRIFIRPRSLFGISVAGGAPDFAGWIED